ncbi:MAG TPA: cupredoxin domain-containing protein [Solirubrobacteraceae bacterium]|nr:cupredoxin domain-containing protein [Solirubrobacteraceae bacterium]
MSVRIPLLTALAVACAAALAGCGEEDPVRIEDRELRVELDEFRIVPEDVSVAPGRLRIVATNVGRLTHNLHVVKEDEEDREAPPTDLGGTSTAQPGETATYTFENLRPGEYRMVCTIANHDDLGQYGELIVREERG